MGDVFGPEAVEEAGSVETVLLGLLAEKSGLERAAVDLHVAFPQAQAAVDELHENFTW